MPIVPPRRKRELVLLLGALSAFGPFSIDMYLPALPVLRRELDTSVSQAQLTLSACLIGLAVGQLVAGPLSDVIGRRKPLLVGIAGYALASLLCALAPSIWTLIGLRFLQGLAGAAGVVISRAIVRDFHPGTAAARFFSLLMLVSGAAPILAPVAGGQVLSLTSWRGVFVVLAGIGVLLFIAVYFRLPETIRHENRQTGGLPKTLRTFRQLLGDRAFVGYGICSGLAVGSVFTYVANSSFVLQDLYGVSPQLFSLLFGVNALGMMIVGQINGRLVDRVSLNRLLGAGLVASVLAGCLLLAMVLSGRGGLVGLMPALFVVVSSLGLVLPNTAALALSPHAHHAGSAAAILGLAQFAIGAAIAPLAGLGGETSALPMAILLLVLGVCALAVFLLVALPAARRATPPPVSPEPAGAG